MSLTTKSRQLHRWMSALFTITVLSYIVMSALHPGQQPPPYITYAPLLPPALLFFTGLYPFALPYLARRA
ncbi:MAG: hypothetical protein IPK12_08250 [Gemmatimonadetes bacterium]|nr:hypothetical protein [Gemmatimonadota bacterium]